MGQINIPQPTLLEELLSIILGGAVILLLVGLIAALVCLFKKTVPPFLKRLSKGAIPLIILCIAVQAWKILSEPKQRDMESGSLVWITVSILGLLSWIYLIQRKGRHT
jgi:hypothetical protein